MQSSSGRGAPPVHSMHLRINAPYYGIPLSSANESSSVIYRWFVCRTIVVATDADSTPRVVMLQLQLFPVAPHEPSLISSQYEHEHVRWLAAAGY